MKSIIVFDGECLMCNRFILFILRKDIQEKHFFTTQQSEFWKEYIQKIPREYKVIDSILLLQDGVILTYSTAIIKIFRSLGGLYSLFSVFYIIPKSLRDRLYKYMAKHRLFLFGQADSCLLLDKTKNYRIL